jgi:hypothetical protein
MRFAKHHFPKRNHSHAAARLTRKELIHMSVRCSHHFLSYSIAQYRASAQPAAVADAAARRARSVRFQTLEVARQLSRSIGAAQLSARC